MMMQEIDKIMKFNIGNTIVYNLICKDVMNVSEKQGGIMPFIGDGLSEFAFGVKENFIDDVLDTMAESLSDSEQKKLKEQVQSEDFLESLDNLKDIMGGKYGEFIINEHLEEFYSDDKIDIHILENQAVSLIPLLNCGDSITINFDHVLEYAYELAGVNPAIATPYDCKILNQKMRDKREINRALLFKIHGDIISNATERIITKAAFEKNYRENTEFTENLTKWIQKYKLLFIGVDLLKDKYLRGILEKTKSEGIKHYAIVGCENVEATKKKVREQLSDLNVLPIIYDVNYPNSIEIILHKILVDTKNEGLTDRGEFHYKYSEHDLVGREKEINKLQEFLTKDSGYTFDFKWWMIWGQNITGKSKLAYEFARKHAQGWDWYMLNPGQVDIFFENQIRIGKNRSGKRKIFIIFDDYDCYSGGIEKVLEFIKAIRRYCLKIRVLFIVRDCVASEIYKIGQDRERKDDVRVMLLKTAFAGPLEIKQLSIEDIKQVCFKYILYRKKELGLGSLKDEDLLQIDDDLEQYIEELIDQEKSLILLCSLKKALSLIMNNIGVPKGGLSDSEIITQVMRYVLTDGEGNLNNPNVDIWEIDRRKVQRKEQGIRLLEKYDKEKEYDKEYYKEAYEMDNFIFSIEKDVGI